MKEEEEEKEIQKFSFKSRAEILRTCIDTKLSPFVQFKDSLIDSFEKIGVKLRSPFVQL